MNVRIDIGICTFRRPQITETLRSVAALVVPDEIELRIIVADNDDTPSAKTTVSNLQLPFPLSYVHAPSRNISIARNAILEHTTASYLAFVDDDERVDPFWLRALYNKAIAQKADVVFGPVIAEYPENCPEWIVSGDYHSVTESETVSQVQTGATCNVLIHLNSKAYDGLRFDRTLGKSGGEDTVFFHEIASRGGLMFFAHDALVYEKALPQRLSADWLIKRRYRSGQSHAVAMLRAPSATILTRIALASKASAKTVACYGAMAFCFSNTDRRLWWRIRGALHRGVVSKCFGSREDTLYGFSQ